MSNHSLISLVIESDFLSRHAGGRGVFELLIMQKNETDVIFKLVYPGKLS